MDNFVLISIAITNQKDLAALQYDLKNIEHFFDCAGISLTSDQYWNYYFAIFDQCPSIHDIWMCVENATYISLKYC